MGKCQYFILQTAEATKALLAIIVLGFNNSDSVTRQKGLKPEQKIG